MPGLSRAIGAGLRARGGDMQNILAYAAGLIAIAWGVAHLAPTRAVVNGFGAISADNRRIVTMEWIGEGLTLCFIGALVLLVTILASPGNPLVPVVWRASAAMLVVMAVLTGLTTARSPPQVFKICALVKATAAGMLLAASWIG